jgi:hypothetical protein
LSQRYYKNLVIAEGLVEALCSLVRLTMLFAQRRKQYHITDAGTVGEKHHEPINADSTPTSWRHCVL